MPVWLCALHNLYFYNTMMAEIRESLDEGSFAAYKQRKLAGMEEGQCALREDEKRDAGKGAPQEDKA